MAGRPWQILSWHLLPPPPPPNHGFTVPLVDSAVRWEMLLGWFSQSCCCSGEKHLTCSVPPPLPRERVLLPKPNRFLSGPSRAGVGDPRERTRRSRKRLATQKGFNLRGGFCEIHVSSDALVEDGPNLSCYGQDQAPMRMLAFSFQTRALLLRCRC